MQCELEQNYWSHFLEERVNQKFSKQIIIIIKPYKTVG